MLAKKVLIYPSYDQSQTACSRFEKSQCPLQKLSINPICGKWFEVERLFERGRTVLYRVFEGSTQFPADYECSKH
jgi:hypothetical protein